MSHSGRGAKKFRSVAPVMVSYKRAPHTGMLATLIMTNTKLFATAILSLAACAPMSAQTATPDADGYILVWQELFNGESLNPERWDIEVNGGGGGNNELQYYTDREENVRLGDDGKGNHCLILTARREQYLGKKITSGRVNTKNRIAFTHGKVEAAIKLPKTANGLWPAFWMMGNDYDRVGWPKCGETDILEMGHSNGFVGFQEKFFNGAMHWGQGWPSASHAKDTTWPNSLQDGEFHIFTCVWDENSMKMYCDLDKYPRQNPYFSMDIPCNDPDNEWSPGNYFHKDNFILFNLAVGGNFPGIHDAEKITALNDENGHEASMYVDYVKIYQKGVASEHKDFLDPGDPIDASGITEIEYADDAEPEYYTINGIKLSKYPEESGIYIERTGTATKKIIVR